MDGSSSLLSAFDKAVVIFVQLVVNQRNHAFELLESKSFWNLQVPLFQSQ
jgi:hypothetical protein